jgi:AcrR family transcriptional regulator
MCVTRSAAPEDNRRQPSHNSMSVSRQAIGFVYKDQLPAVPEVARVTWKGRRPEVGSAAPATAQAAPAANIVAAVSSDPPGERPEQPDELARLPHGRHGLPAEFVAHNQSRRLLASLIGIVAEQGYNAATITAITDGAGVTTRTFYKYFDSVEACYLAAFEAVVELLAARLEEAWEEATGWPAQVRAAIAAALEFFAASPELARLLLTEPFVAGPTISRRYQSEIERAAPYLAEGRELSAEGPSFPASTERGLIGSITSQIGRKVSSGEAEKLPNLLPDLVQFALTPYLGAAEARRIALAKA